MSAIKGRLSKIEAQVKADPQLNIGQWFLKLIRGGDEYENMRNAAIFLAIDGVIDEPPKHIWDEVVDSFDTQSVENRTASQEWFYEVSPHEGREAVLAEITEESELEGLCMVAIMFYETFKEAPFNGTLAERVARTDALHREFLMPLMEKACPDLKGYSQATFTAWIEEVLKDDSEDFDFLKSLRDYTAKFHKTKNDELTQRVESALAGSNPRADERTQGRINELQKVALERYEAQA